MTDIYAGMDIGYAYTKLFSDRCNPVAIPSVTGTADEARFSMGETSVISIEIDGKSYFVGDAAILSSRISLRREERSWIDTPEYKAIFHAALSHLASVGKASMSIVTGLPVSYYAEDKDKLRDTLLGVHGINRHGRPPQEITVEKVVVVPQGMGVAVDAALSEDGLSIVDALVADGDVGIIDVGGKTTNFQRVHNMSDVRPQTDSVTLGSWDAVRAAKEPVQNICPDAEYGDHEIAAALAIGSIRYKGGSIDIRDATNSVIEPMADGIIARAAQLWDNFTKLDVVIVAGGGATVFGEAIKSKIEHENVRIAPEPMFANVRGYYKLALRMK